MLPRQGVGVTNGSSPFAALYLAIAVARLYHASQASGGREVVNLAIFLCGKCLMFDASPVGITDRECVRPCACAVRTTGALYSPRVRSTHHECALRAEVVYRDWYSCGSVVLGVGAYSVRTTAFNVILYSGGPEERGTLSSGI